MRNLIHTILSTMFLLTFCTKKIAHTINSSEYTIKEIQKKNSWYIIYAEKRDTLYKIVSKIENNVLGDHEMIRIGFSYNIEIHSYKDSAPSIGGIKVDPVGFTGCYQFDTKTNICLEPQKGIYDLYIPSNLKGIYLMNHRKIK